jgi:hypothetical protein
MAAAKYNISIDQGSDYATDITITESGSAKDLTNYSARAQLRSAVQSEVVEGAFICTIADPTTGVINISMTNAVSKLLDPRTYVYDLEIFTAGDAFVQRILYGTVKVVAEVTR